MEPTWLILIIAILIIGIATCKKENKDTKPFDPDAPFQHGNEVFSSWKEFKKWSR